MFRRAALATLAMIALSSCGSTAPTENSPANATGPAAAPSPAPSASVTAEDDPRAEAALEATLQDVFTKQSPFTGPAAAEFGADQVMSAYRHLVAFTLRNSFEPTLIAHRDSYTEVDFSFLDRYLTQVARDDWSARVAAAVSGNEEAKKNVYLLTLYDVSVPGWTLATDNPVRNQQASTASTLVADETTVDGRKRLVMRIKVTADLVFEQSDQQIATTVTKDMTYTVIPNDDSDVPWIIDGWKGEYSSSEFTPV